jgi:SAM-dependent methyltransferase
MRRVVVIAGVAAAAAGAVTLSRHRAPRPEAATSSEEDHQFTHYAPGGPQGFLFNGPVGWAFAKIQPISHAGVYQVVAEMLDLRPEDELLDIGCGPGAFLADKARHIRRVVGLDASRVMLREAEKRLADRIAAGTARLVLGNSAALAFSDDEFSAVTVITAPANLSEVFRVLRPGGRLVFVDELTPDPRKPSSERAGGDPRNWTEADTRRILEDAGFADLAIRYKGVWRLADNRIVSCQKPVASRPNAAAETGRAQMGTDEVGAAAAEAIAAG